VFGAGAFTLLTYSIPPKTLSLVPPTAFAYYLSTVPVDLNFVLVGGGGGGGGGRTGIWGGLFLILVFFVLVLAPLLPFRPHFFFLRFQVAQIGLDSGCPLNRPLGLLAHMESL